MKIKACRFALFAMLASSYACPIYGQIWPFNKTHIREIVTESAINSQEGIEQPIESHGTTSTRSFKFASDPWDVYKDHHFVWQQILVRLVADAKHPATVRVIAQFYLKGDDFGTPVKAKRPHVWVTLTDQYGETIGKRLDLVVLVMSGQERDVYELYELSVPAKEAARVKGVIISGGGTVEFERNR